MKRALIFFAAFVLALVAARGVPAAPQTKGSAILSGVATSDLTISRWHTLACPISCPTAARRTPCTRIRTGVSRLRSCRSDNYDIRASAKGIFSEWQKNISVRKGQTKSIELRLIYAREMPKPVSSTKSKQ